MHVKLHDLFLEVGDCWIGECESGLVEGRGLCVGNAEEVELKV